MQRDQPWMVSRASSVPSLAFVLAYSRRRPTSGALSLPDLLILTRAPLRFGIDRALEIGMIRGERAEVGKVENEKGRRHGRVDVGAAHRIAEQGELAEKSPGAEPHRHGLDIDLHFAPGNKVHAVADLAAADDGDALGHFEAPQHVGDFRDRRRLERLEERHFADEIPGLDEIAPAVFGGEAGGENAGRQTETDDAKDHDHAAEQMTE